MPKIITITSPLAADSIEFISLHGTEKLSALYQFDIKMRYGGKPIKASDIIGKPMIIQLQTAKQPARYFSGIVGSFRYGIADQQALCELQLVPTLWQLQFTRNSRIFQQLSVKSIIGQILQEYGIACNTSKLNGTYANLDYCVQWQESDFAFITRLMEQAGIFYYFEHQQNGHQLMLADSINAYKDCLQQARIMSAGQAYAQIISWQVNYNFYAGKCTVNSHDFTNPAKQLSANSKTIKPLAGNDKYEMYTYPTAHLTTEQGTQHSKLNIQQLETQAQLGYGSSTYTELVLCGKLSLDAKQLPAEQGKNHVITELCHQLTTEGGDGLCYHNQFVSIPAEVVFRPPIITPKPVAPAMQLGTIVGPSGKEIYTDQYGRMKVQFVWDRSGKTDEKSSCWMRAIQQWDGLLRIGTPVVISFVDGDLNQPLIIGPVYNANLMPLYNLSDEQTKSSLKRRLVKKADEKAYNEIRFDDKKDQQELYIHATKDLLIEVENDAIHKIKQGNLTITVDKGKAIITIKGDVSLQTDGTISVNAKQDITMKTSGDLTMSANNINLKAQNNLQTKAGAKLTQQALDINTTASAKIQQKAALQTIQSDGILTLKGGLIKEN